MEQLNIYQSGNSDNETIKKGFIVRQMEFQIIMEALSRRSAKDPLQHELILGRRGSGKSTLLKRIEIEVEETLSKKYIPINLAEEQASVYRLFDLWLEVVKELKINVKNYSEFDEEQNYTRYLYQKIHEFYLVQKKKIVLILDNFDRIVENLTDDGNLLREILINHNDLVIIAASTRMDEHFWQYDKPFYEFFRLHHLEALNINEIKKLFYHWADVFGMKELKLFVDNNPGKLHTVRILTDGLPRTLQLYIRLVVQNDYAGKGVEYLKKIMDSVTPLFQERLNNLPPQLRKMTLEMAFIWEACSTKDLAAKCMMESKLISANLKTLTDKGIVDKIETDKRNLLYRISERFFNMWLIMTQGNLEQKQKAKWMNVFLENWFNATDKKTVDNEYNNQNMLAEPQAFYSRAARKSGIDDDNLATFYYRKNMFQAEALKYIQQYDVRVSLQIIIELWNGIFRDVEKRTLAVVMEEPDTANLFIFHLLIHQQKILVLNLFNHPDVGQKLQDEYKVLHYVCLILNKKTEDNLILKIPPEIKETIDGVINKIADNERFYGYKIRTK
jgi:energy-coupling factor transporter ATP-binding protein EcfA2